MSPPTESKGKRRVAMVVFSYYPDDPRVRREAEALVSAGMVVDVICLRRQGDETPDMVDGVGVHRLPVMRKRGSPLRYIWEYMLFFFLASSRLASLHIRRQYDVIHIHNMPDFLVFTAALPRLGGARIILDLHDPMPEVFMTKYDLPASHAAIRLLLRLERWSIRFSHLVLTPNIAFQRLFASRGCPEGKVHVVMNSPDPKIFGEMAVPGPTLSPASRFTLMYHGTIVERHGLGTALEALCILKKEIPHLEFHVYGEGDFVPEFQRMTRDLGLTDVVKYHGHVPLEVIALRIADVHVGIIPNKRSVFTEINLPTRIFEYLSKGKPVVAPRTRGIADYFNAESIHLFEPGDSGSLADAVLGIFRNPEDSRTRLIKGCEVYKQHSWVVQKNHLISLVQAI